jgi:hypothetical protein
MPKLTCNFCTATAIVKLFVRWDLLIPVKGLPPAQGHTALFCEKHLTEAHSAMEALGTAKVEAPAAV